MKVRNSVYGSQNEKELFQILNSRWLDKFDIFLSLPLANILEIAPSDLTDGERSFFYKTSVDYTLCDKNGKPLLSIEFDGLGRGFSKRDEYIQVVPIKTAPHRKLKMDAKLRWCSSVLFPMIVVSYEEKNPFAEDVDLTLVDGIVGQFYGSLKSHEMIQSHDWEEETKGLSPAEAHEKIQDLVIDMGIGADLDFNPLVRKAAELEHKAFELKLFQKTAYIPVNDPELPEGMTTLERIRNFDKIVMRVGWRVEVDTPFGKVSETVLVRNLTGVIEPASLAQEIANIKVFSRILKMHEEKKK